MTRCPSLALAAVVLAAPGCGSDGPEQARSATLPPLRALDTPGCAPLAYGGSGRPDVLVGMSSLLQGDYALSHGLPAAHAVKLAFRQRGWKAGSRSVALQVCDETDARTGLPGRRTCLRNARAFARNRSVVAVIGPYFSTCALTMVAVANRAPGGPLTLVSGGNSYVGLTRSGPGARGDEPGRHYPTGRRNYARVVPADDAQAAAAVIHARDAGLRRPFALHNGDAYGRGVAEGFRRSAEALGLEASGSSSWDPEARGYRRLVARVRRAGADGVFLGGYHTDNGARLIKDLRTGLGRGFPVIASDGFADAGPLVEGAGSRAEGVVIVTGVLPPSQLPPAGRRFAADYQERFGQRPCCYAVHFAQAAQVVLDAIARSDGTRSEVTAEVFRTEVRDGLLGNFSIDRHGDITVQTLALYEIREGRLRFLRKLTAPQEVLARR